MSDQEPRLCYVSDGRAYFAVKDPKDVWGDDWDDRPYEHNAEPPYEYDLKVMFDGDWAEPYHGFANSVWSVKDINNGAVAWLRPMYPNKFEGEIPVIHAGATLSEFLGKIPLCDGVVYLPVAPGSAR